MRWMGVPEAEARMVEAMYERTKGRVVVGHRMLGGMFALRRNNKLNINKLR